MVSSGKPGRAVLARDLARQHRAHGAMNVADRQLDLDRRPVLDRLLRVVDQLVIERFIETVILRDGAAARRRATGIGGL